MKKMLSDMWLILGIVVFMIFFLNEKSVYED